MYAVTAEEAKDAERDALRVQFLARNAPWQSVWPFDKPADIDADEVHRRVRAFKKRITRKEVDSHGLREAILDAYMPSVMMCVWSPYRSKQDRTEAAALVHQFRSLPFYGYREFVEACAVWCKKVADEKIAA